MTRDIAKLAAAIIEAETLLPKSFGSHVAVCDDWCKLWMLLVGAWHSLDWAMPFLQAAKLKEVLLSAHEEALIQVRRKEPASIPTTGGPNAWFAGYFLVSAEHRIANTLDRATNLAARPLELAAKQRRIALARGCLRCCNYQYEATVAAMLRDDGSAIVTVYKRVNAIKHHGVETAIDELSTEQRWNDAYDAAMEGAAIVGALAAHDARCGSQSV